MTLGEVVLTLVFPATSPLHRIEFASPGLRLSLKDNGFDWSRLDQFFAAFCLRLRVFFHDWDSLVRGFVSFLAGQGLVGVGGFVGVVGLQGFVGVCFLQGCVGVGFLQGCVGVGGRRT